VALALLLNTGGQLAEIGLFAVPADSSLLVLGVAIAPLTEEFAKAVGLGLGARELDEPEDGLIHGAAIGLGFGATENLVYGLAVLDKGDLFFQTLAARSFTSMLLHAGSTAIVGYAVSRHRHRLRRGWRILGAYLLAVLVHAAYNALILAPSAFGADPRWAYAAFLGAVLGVFALVGWVRHAVRRHDRGPAHLGFR
jgi:RsiW-degrading membrane proteinase PrsW (M82 family)